MSTIDVTHKLQELTTVVNRAISEQEGANHKLLQDNAALSREVQAWREVAGTSDPKIFAERKTWPGLVVTPELQRRAVQGIKTVVADYVARGRASHLDVADLMPTLMHWFPVTGRNGHRIKPNDQELAVCTICGAAEVELSERTCVEQLKKELEDSAHLFARDIKVWQEATGRTFPYEAKQDLESLREEIKLQTGVIQTWQAATGCNTPNDYGKKRETEVQGWRHSRELAEGALSRIAGLLGVDPCTQTLKDFYDEIVLRVEGTRNKAETIPANHLEWQHATGCTSPNVIAERLSSFRKMLDCGAAEGIPDGIERLTRRNKAQFETIQQLQKQLSEAQQTLIRTKDQLVADRDLWQNRWEVFKGHLHELGCQIGCSQRDEELTETFLLRCTEVVRLLVRQKQGPEPLQWSQAAPLTTLPVGFLHVCRVIGRVTSVDLVTVKGLMASAGCEHWLLGPLPELPPPPPGAPRPEMPDLLTLRCLEDDKLYVGTLHPVLHRYQVFKGGRWFEAPMNEFEVVPC